MRMTEWYLERVGRILRYCDMDVQPRRFLWFNLWFTLLGSALPALYFINESPALAAVAFLGTAGLMNLVIFGFLHLTKNRRASAAEEAMPDFLLLVANNTRAGFTPDRALALAAKPEFGVLSTEVVRVTHGETGGKPFEELFSKITLGFDSMVVNNTVNLIVEGMYSGGDLPSLLESTSYDIRNFRTVRKDIQSVIMTYEMFIAAAVMFGAPILFSVATYIVELMGNIRSRMDIHGMPPGGGGLLSMANAGNAVPTETLVMFVVVAMFVNCVSAAIGLGIIHSGKKSEGLKYFPVLFLISITLFFLMRLGLQAAMNRYFPK